MASTKITQPFLLPPLAKPNIPSPPESPSEEIPKSTTITITTPITTTLTNTNTNTYFPTPNHTHPRPQKDEMRQQKDRWFYPPEIAQDLHAISPLLPPGFADEALACAWEYTRCVIPQFTNWERYLAFCRVIVVGVVAEFRGGVVDVFGSFSCSSALGCSSSASDLNVLREGSRNGNRNGGKDGAGDGCSCGPKYVLGRYDIDELLDTIFGERTSTEGGSLREDMGREYRAFLLVTACKSSGRRDSELFRRYVHALARSPKEWYFFFFLLFPLTTCRRRPR